jgi:hypothetical protein
MFLAMHAAAPLTALFLTSITISAFRYFKLSLSFLDAARVLDGEAPWRGQVLSPISVICADQW